MNTAWPTSSRFRGSGPPLRPGSGSPSAAASILPSIRPSSAGTTRSRRAPRCSAASRCCPTSSATARSTTRSARTRLARRSSRRGNRLKNQDCDMPAEKIGVIGAGLMGAEIALVFALAGHDVVLSDRTDEQLAAAKNRLATVLDRGIQRGFFKAEDKEPALGLIRTTTALADFADRDFVTEAVFEDEAVKAEIYRTLDRVCGPGVILASNTSTIPISTLASYVGEARRPRFLGTHYFSPASRMKLVEIIPAFETAPEVVETAIRLCRDAGKTPIRVKDVAGFAVNRMFLIFLAEAVRLVEDGVATPEDIDTACRLGLGHPMGPFELMDAIGSKLAFQTLDILHEAYGERFRAPALLKQRVRAGFVGGRGNKGWRNQG